MDHKMDQKSEFDWANASEAEQAQYVRRMSVYEHDKVMRTYDWSQYPVTVLGWLKTQKGIGLHSALACFFNGDPWRFNYLPKHDVSESYREEVKLLDGICQRINAGFYLPDTIPCEKAMKRLEAWLKSQREDYREHRRGRWVIEAHALEPLLISKRRELEDEVRRETARLEAAAPVASLKNLSLKKIVRARAS